MLLVKRPRSCPSRTWERFNTRVRFKVVIYVINRDKVIVAGIHMQGSITTCSYRTQKAMSRYQACGKRVDRVTCCHRGSSLQERIAVEVVALQPQQVVMQRIAAWCVWLMVQQPMWSEGRVWSMSKTKPCRTIDVVASYLRYPAIRPQAHRV
mmetsp:Transcript_26078/g.85780  ORF Transcript_26078/g.85780 Transcript_26078/m.85780 type:complete len:152 (-) Transcript_26078:1198-1653(-)